MKAALYARVSTVDKDQNPEVQLDQLRDYCSKVGWEIVGEYVDHASAADFVKRKDWTRLMKDASIRKFDTLLVWKLDRACRSAMDGANILGTLRAYGIGFKSYMEQYIDTTTPWGEAMYHITAAWAGLEKEMIRTRVNAGLDHARRHGTKSGKAIGRPRRSMGFKKVLEAWQAGGYSFTNAGIALGVNPGTVWNRVKEISNKTGLSFEELKNVDPKTTIRGLL